MTSVITSNIHHGSGERMEIEEHMTAEEEALNILELRKKARSMHVSTEDSEVKAYLRQLGEPTILFGEDPAMRRSRLQMLCVTRNLNPQRPSIDPNSTANLNNNKDSSHNENTVWYHEGPESLRIARMWLAEYSLLQTKKRLAEAKKYFAENPEAQRKARMHEHHKKQKSMTLHGSQIGDNRPIVFCSFSPNGEALATASWSGLCRIWEVPSMNPISSLRGHESNTSCINWHPRSTIDQDRGSINLASCSHDGSVKLWSLDNEHPLADIEGHKPNRVTRVVFHPSGRFLGTTCHDKSWRLWDLEQCDEILHQEGHSKAIYDLKFHPDGSLALTSSMDSYARMWDLRTGRCIMFFEGHLEDCVGVDIADNGIHALTCSVDNTVRIYDLRQQQPIYIIPSHNSVVSAAKFEPKDGGYIVTASFDKTCKIWGHPVWTCLKSLKGHSNRISYVDISPKGGEYLATCSHDCTFKLWTRS